MKELGHLGICTYEESGNGDASKIVLKDMYDELLENSTDQGEKDFDDLF